MADHLPKDIRVTIQKLKNRANKEDLRLLQKLDVQLGRMVPAERGDGVMRVESGVSSTTKLPFVTVTWGTLKGQLSPIEARQYALQIMETAEASIQDAALLSGAVELNMGEDTGFRLIQMVREHRRKFEQE